MTSYHIAFSYLLHIRVVSHIKRDSSFSLSIYEVLGQNIEYDSHCYIDSFLLPYNSAYYNYEASFYRTDH
jgi:hypothetical protein